MYIQKILYLSTITASLVLITGCTTVQTATNTNEVSNTNTNSTNAIAVANTNENTNTEQGSEVDTSDWVRYENESMGVKFNYPSEWKIDEYYENDSWKNKSDEASAWVKFITTNNDELIISRGRNETIKEEVSEPTEIQYVEVEYATINGYNAAQIKSLNKFVSDEISTATWIEIEEDLIRMPDIKEFPELEQIIISFEIIEA